MRTTVRIDDELLRDLKEQAHREGTSLAKFLNRVLRRGLEVLQQRITPARPFREKTFPMGEPRVNLDKALALAVSMEDEESREELIRRK